MRLDGEARGGVALRLFRLELHQWCDERRRERLTHRTQHSVRVSGEEKRDGSSGVAPRQKQKDERSNARG